MPPAPTPAPTEETPARALRPVPCWRMDVPPSRRRPAPEAARAASAPPQILRADLPAPRPPSLSPPSHSRTRTPAFTLTRARTLQVAPPPSPAPPPPLPLPLSWAKSFLPKALCPGLEGVTSSSMLSPLLENGRPRTRAAAGKPSRAGSSPSAPPHQRARPGLLYLKTHGEGGEAGDPPWLPSRHPRPPSASCP